MIKSNNIILQIPNKWNNFVNRFNESNNEFLKSQPQRSMSTSNKEVSNLSICSKQNNLNKSIKDQENLSKTIISNTQTDEVNELKEKLWISSSTIVDQETLLKSFEALCYRLKSKLETQSFVDKTFRKISMHILHLYKDFELFSEEQSKCFAINEGTMHTNIKNQLENLLKLTDIRVPEDIHTENQLLISEYQQLIKNLSSSKELVYISSHRNSINLSKISANDTSNVISFTNWVDKTTGSASPHRGLKNNWTENSFYLSNANNAELEILRKDLLRITEENRSLKLKLKTDQISVPSKWKLCK